MSLTPTLPPQNTPPLCAPPQGGQQAGPPDPSSLLFNKTWWLFFQALLASLSNFVTPPGQDSVTNVKRYGAVLDGVTDDTAAVNRAMVAANASAGAYGAGRLYFPA